jgi:pilus assembly protein Flp/PilA
MSRFHGKDFFSPLIAGQHDGHIPRNCIPMIYSTLRGSTQSHTLKEVGGLADQEEKLVTYQIKQFLCDETAATAIEYGLIAAGIALAIIAIINGLGTNLLNIFTAINSSLK